MTELAAEIAVPIPLEETYHYRIPDKLRHQVSLGVRVQVPFGEGRRERVLTGYVLGVCALPDRKLKEIREVVDQAPLFNEENLALARWISDYYMTPLGEVLRAMLPAARIKPKLRKYLGLKNPLTPEELEGYRRSPKVRALLAFLSDHGPTARATLKEAFGELGHVLSRLRKEGLLKEEDREISHSPFRDHARSSDSPLVLTADQKRAYRKIGKSLKTGGYAPFLLFGVTGSGKTEVYLQVITDILNQGRSVIVLVPEIALTPLLSTRFRARFGDEVAILHSALSPAERHDQWQRLRRGQAHIAIGARSAIFAPVKDLGLVVIDEEHVQAFKQEERPRYNARDVALVRAKMSGAVAILGSATPSLETLHNARIGKLEYLSLPQRIDNRPLPRMELVDLTQKDQMARWDALISKRLLAALSDTLSRGEQAILFLNRRGFSPFVICQECGHVFECIRCNISLTYHRLQNQLKCHYCGYAIPRPHDCPACSSRRIDHLGRGTERLEFALRELLPRARIARMDRDTVSRWSRMKGLLERFGKGEVDILLGTQMVAKGHDFPGVTLVGVIAADQGLNLPDFRAAERTWQLLVQVAGRAGRGEREGRVIVQTFNPRHYAIVHAVKHDYRAFSREELGLRQKLGYPPYTRLVAIRGEERDRQSADRASALFAERAQSLFSAHPEWRGEIEVVGPAISPLTRIKGKERWMMLVKGRGIGALHQFVRELQKGPAGQSRGPHTRIAIDVDPLDML